jgi:hypothetical protein
MLSVGLVTQNRGILFNGGCYKAAGRYHRLWHNRLNRLVDKKGKERVAIPTVVHH